MGERCALIQAEIVANKERRSRILADPKRLHAELFADFTPAGYAEYAGTYRGTPGTTLANRRSTAPSQLKQGSEFEFVSPDEVEGRMERMLNEVHRFLGEGNAGDYGNLLLLTYAFCWFGKIHPFLDGNGHVQRALFATIATELGYPLTNRFAIHPRPYDRLLAIALEIFTSAPENNENNELGLPAEYLGFFLGGEFDAPRKNLAASTPET